MSKESIVAAIDATAAAVRNVQRATRHRSDWLFVRLETLDAWAQERGIVLTAPGALDQATRLFFEKGNDAKVVAGVDGTNSSLLAIWCREGEPTYDPPWDGMPPWIREALPTLGEDEGVVTVVADPEPEPEPEE